MTNRDYEEASKYPSKNHTQEEILNKLIGYIKIPEIYWDDELPKGCWYRYISKTKGFRSGGFLIKNENKFLAFKNISQNFSWSTQKEDIACLYFRPRKNNKKHQNFINNM